MGSKDGEAKKTNSSCIDPTICAWRIDPLYFFPSLYIKRQYFLLIIYQVRTGIEYVWQRAKKARACSCFGSVGDTFRVRCTVGLLLLRKRGWEIVIPRIIQERERSRYTARWVLICEAHGNTHERITLVTVSWQRGRSTTPPKYPQNRCVHLCSLSLCHAVFSLSLSASFHPYTFLSRSGSLVQVGAFVSFSASRSSRSCSFPSYRLNRTPLTELSNPFSFPFRPACVVNPW